MNIFGILCVVFMAINFGLIGLVFSGVLERHPRGEITCYVVQPICGLLNLVFFIFALCM